VGKDSKIEGILFDWAKSEGQRGYGFRFIMVEANRLETHMLTVTIRADAPLLDEVVSLATSSPMDLQITDERGLDGTQVVQVVLEYGPPAIALLKSIIELIEAGDRLRKRWSSIEIKNDKPDKE